MCFTTVQDAVNMSVFSLFLFKKRWELLNYYIIVLIKTARPDSRMAVNACYKFLIKLTDVTRIQN